MVYLRSLSPLIAQCFHCAIRVDWVKDFRLGRETVEEIGYDGRPVEMLTPETIALIEEKVLSDRRLKIIEIEARLGLFKSIVHCAICEYLHMKKVSARGFRNFFELFRDR